MQVMQGAEFKQEQVVIGQQTKTKGFSVSDDPMLMSILSTGLYQNPLKSMIQEAVFNAWDAHKASNRTDKPIEIIFTDDNQLIISDSGYGSMRFLKLCLRWFFDSLTSSFQYHLV